MPASTYDKLATQRMENIAVRVEGIKKQLLSLNPKKATSSDGVGPRVLKDMAEVLALPLARPFQTSLEKGGISND